MFNTGLGGLEITAVPKMALTIAEVVAATSIGRTKVYDEIKAGRLKPSKIGDRTIISVDELKRWLSSSEVQPR